MVRRKNDVVEQGPQAQAKIACIPYIRFPSLQLIKHTPICVTLCGGEIGCRRLSFLRYTHATLALIRIGLTGWSELSFWATQELLKSEGGEESNEKTHDYYIGSYAGCLSESSLRYRCDSY